MKNLLLALFTLVVINCSGATYYFSSQSGDDSRTATNAQNPETPWKTLEKFNSFSANFQPGDQVLFKRGETFVGSMVITKSGTAAMPITIGAYGTGARPVISGFGEVANWVSTGNNIYESTCSTCPAYLNLVLFQDTIQPKGRYPKLTAPLGGYIALNSHVGTSSITSNAIGSIPNFNGAELIIRPFGWIFNKAIVNSQSSTTINYTPLASPSHPDFTYEPQNGYGFFFQNHVNTLTQTGDWMYDAATKKLKMYFAGQNPGSYNVRYGRVEKLVTLFEKSNITFSGLAFKGANTNAFRIDTSHNITLNNCEIDQTGVDAIYVSKKSSGITVKDCIISNSLNNGISANGSTVWDIRNNLIKNTGLFRGMGVPGDGSHNAISHPGSNTKIVLNQIRKTGYIGVDFQGDSVLIERNFIDSFCLIKSDGGGIYAASETDKINRQVLYNIVTNGIGDRFGRSQAEIDNPFAGNVHGIYMDLGAAAVTIIGNTSANSANSGLQLSSSSNMIVRNNTFFNNIMTQIFYYESGNPFSKLISTNNISFSKESDQLIALFRAKADNQKSWGIIDSNYYARPVSEPQGVDTIGYSHAPTLFDYPDGGIIQAANERFYSLDTWQALSKQDSNTVKTPPHSTDLSALRFEYNNTTSPKTIPLSGTYFDVKNQFYHNSVTLQPFSSVILLKYTGTALTNQTITFPAISGKTFGNPPVTISATATSGLPVSFEVISGPGTLNGNVVTITGAGPIVIEAKQAGNTTYNAAPAVRQTITVQKSNQTIQFGTISTKTAGDPPFSLSATASSGLPVSFRVVSGPATLNNNLLTLTGAGSVVIEASQAGNNNFNAASVVTRTFTVNSPTQVPPPPPVCSATGTILREQWSNIFGTAVTDIPLLSTPNSSSQITKLETENTGDWMGARVRGYLCPPLSGSYTFYLSGDDGVELWLSTDENADIKKKIAGYTGWTGFHEWDKYPAQKSSPITLEAGKNYYIEVLHKNGGGGDHFSVKWDLPNGTTEAPIPGSRLSPFKLNGTSKANQTISFGVLPPGTIGDAPVILQATATSNLPVSFKVLSGPAIVNGNILGYTGTGTIVVEALQAGNEAYHPAPAVTRSFVVNPAPDETPDITCSATGSILREEWQNVNGISVSDIPLNSTPTRSHQITQLETENTGSNMGARIRGYICAPISGNYTFYLSGDDGVELWLSTNYLPSNKVKIAGYAGWTGLREWDKYPGQTSNPINLQAGKKYYIEILHKNGGGGDNVSVKWLMPNGISEVPVSGNRLSPFVPAGLVKVSQSINFPVIFSKTFGDAPFTLIGSATSALPLTYRIVSGQATLSAGNLLTLTGTGTVVVEATQAGNQTYNAATPVSQSFAVKAAGQPVNNCSATGYILREQWNTIFGTAVSDIPLHLPPAATTQLTSLQTENTGDWMGARIRGYICPPVTGNYTFYIAGDDGVELWLSTSDNPANKKKIAGYVGWTGFQEWDKYPDQKSAPITLQVGKSYYIEVLHKNGAGGDHVSVRWDLPSGTSESPVPGSRLAPYNGNTTTTMLRSTSVAPILNAGSDPNNNVDISIYPNPAQKITFIKVMSSSTGEAVLSLKDLQGRTLKQLFRGNLEARKQRNITFNRDDLKNGVYIISLSTNGQTISKKLVLAK